jgi:hypothetical protein
LPTLGGIFLPVSRKKSAAWGKKSMHSIILIFMMTFGILEQQSCVHISVKISDFYTGLFTGKKKD